MDRKKLGNEGELFVADYLQKNGFTIKATNYRQFFGEIDLIAYKKNLYLFVEVKTRKSDALPMGNLIPASKQAKIIKTAQTFIAENRLTNATFRFDVALLCGDGSTTFTINYIENAFTQSQGRYDYY
ncbi:YraN family protein [Candidatus Babeliales bacterium]|nr:YraN family protein [Candidatus Babeliales bacterium]MBP9844117.1 YraN family protein [Candidatus Babeliales bacterium]